MTEPTGTQGIRIGTAEREAALQALADHMSAGRLDPDEYGDRVAAASGARFTSDLLPLFADLPSGPPLRAAAAVPVSPHVPAPPALPGLVEPYIGLSGREAVGGRVGATIVALSPFIALALFFGAGALGGWSFSWIAFLLVPAAGAIVYGSGGSTGGRRRNR
jgi:hypothetical protein